MTINESIAIVENMIETLEYTDDVFVYNYEEDAIRELINASRKLEKIKNTIDYWIEDCGSDDTMYMVKIEDIVKGER